MTYQSTKTYGHDKGFSCAFRQWRAESHCNRLHGYSLAFKFRFEAKDLDEKNWVVDFGSLKELENELRELFDHKVVVEVNDPCRDEFIRMEKLGILEIATFESVGCEAFAKRAYDLARELIYRLHGERVIVAEVECSEHCGNSASYISDPLWKMEN